MLPCLMVRGCKQLDKKPTESEQETEKQNQAQDAQSQMKHILGFDASTTDMVQQFIGYCLGPSQKMKPALSPGCRPAAMRKLEAIWQT